MQYFGRGNVYVELQRHFHREEEARNHAALDIARSLNLPLVATNGVCHATRKTRTLRRLHRLRHHSTLATAGRLLARNSERHVKSPAEMARLFADLPEAIANTPSSLRAWNSRWPIWAIDSRAIPFPRAKP